MTRIGYVKASDNRVTDNTPFSWVYPQGTYAMMSYNKAATWLYTLEGIIGTETIDEVYREFYREWGFKHPTAADFVNVTSRVVKEIHGEKFGENMDWFFDQTLYGTGICDYKLDGISNSKIRSFKGIVYSDTGMVMLQHDISNDTLYKSTVRIQRLGEVMLPVDILVHFDDGSEILESWDGKARFYDLNYEGAHRAEWAKIDPYMKIYMDVNLVNNSYTIDPDHVPIRKFTRKLSTYLLLLNQFLSL